MLEVRGLTAGYGGIPVVRDLSLTVRSGQVVTLLGPNGSGKTTTLLAISNCIEQLRGEVAIGGETTAGHSPYQLVRKGMAMVPDDRALLPGLTVRESLSLIREPKRDPLEIFPQLHKLLDRKAGLLSGGEQQMLAIARALAPEPKVLLIDELSHGLAPVVCEMLFPIVRLAADEWGAAVLLVEQNVGQALKMADRGYVMHHGSTVIDDEDASVLLHRQDVIEASYLGDRALNENEALDATGSPRSDQTSRPPRSGTEALPEPPPTPNRHGA